MAINGYGGGLGAATGYASTSFGEVLRISNPPISLTLEDVVLFIDMSEVEIEVYEKIQIDSENVQLNINISELRLTNLSRLGLSYGIYIPDFNDTGLFQIDGLTVLQWDDDSLFISEDNIPVRSEQLEKTDEAFKSTVIEKGEF